MATAEQSYALRLIAQLESRVKNLEVESRRLFEYQNRAEQRLMIDEEFRKQQRDLLDTVPEVHLAHLIEAMLQSLAPIKEIQKELAEIRKDIKAVQNSQTMTDIKVGQINQRTRYHLQLPPDQTVS